MEYWKLNFGKRPVEELYNIDVDPYCMNNLADVDDLKDIKAKLASEMTKRLEEQNDPRILGKGSVFDNYSYYGAVQNFYNRYMNGEDVSAGWVNKSDFETDSSFAR